MDLKDHLVPTPCHGQEHFPLDQIAQGLTQPGFEDFQGWGIHELPYPTCSSVSPPSW